MRLTISSIRTVQSEDLLYNLLTAELNRQLSPELHSDLDSFVARLDALTPGLRAMASTYQLDVSMALDDLGWHFANWHHLGYCDETCNGLWELGDKEVAEIFDSAYRQVIPHWDDIGKMLAVDFHVFSEWYHQSRLAEALSPLNNRLWDICERSREFRLLKLWIDYARRHPERVVDSNQTT